MTDRERYSRAAHAMQTGVAMKMNYDPSETEPKHLRVGVNSAMVDSAALAGLLMSKGVFTLQEYEKAIADQMEKEAASYQQDVSSHMGGANIHLH